MPAPLQGYADYQRLIAQGGDVLWDAQIELNAPYTSGIIDARGYGYLNISVNDIGGTAYYWFKIRWVLNSDGSDELSTFVWLPTPGGEQTIQIPVISRYFDISQLYLSGPTTDRPFSVVFGCNAQAQIAVNSQPGDPLLRWQGSIAASSSETIFGTTTIQGPAALTVGDNSNALWEVVLQYYSLSSNSWQNLAVLFGSAYGQSANVIVGLPPCPIRMMVDNTDAAGAHNLYVILNLL